MRFAIDRYERLVARILAGEVVFFVGAGFSLDSEGNTAQRLIARLLARFAAVTEYLASTPAPPEDLRIGLRRTFRIQEGEEIVSQVVVARLADRYYDINDWIISAFDALLGVLCGLPDAARIVKEEINPRENDLLRACRSGGKIDGVPLSPIPLDLLRGLPPGSWGKALFLETMGFYEPCIMAGEPSEGDLQKVMSGYRGLVRDRHRVLARLAREGLCPLLLTTNYDLLLEGACRLAGFEVPPFVGPGLVEERQKPLAAEERLKPPATYDQLYRIGAPTDFFARGAAFRSALLVKIHGCANRYRLERVTPKGWASYLGSIVFTYREIQNWRKDSWSRDLLATLLRTRTMVLCGYSGADPVLHDTFRTVYEEIRSQHGTDPRPGAPDDAVRAYFTGAAVSREFHGLEILRAASRAAGADRPPLTDHPNYLPFYFEGENRFPSLDQLMTWILHRTMRGLQKGALRTDLRRTASQLLGRTVPEAELTSVRAKLEVLDAAERQRAAGWCDEGASSWEFGRLAGWTDRFHTALLREFALAEAVQRNQGPGLRLEHLRSARCYFPISDQPGWAAWGVVVEIAVRRMLEATRDADAPWHADLRWVEPAICEYPAVLFSKSPREPSPRCLLLRFAGFERPGYRPEIRGVYRSLKVWELTAGIEQPSGASAPRARDLWHWAVAPEGYAWSPQERVDAKKWLGDV